MIYSDIIDYTTNKLNNGMLGINDSKIFSYKETHLCQK